MPELPRPAKAFCSPGIVAEDVERARLEILCSSRDPHGI